MIVYPLLKAMSLVGVMMGLLVLLLMTAGSRLSTDVLAYVSTQQTMHSDVYLLDVNRGIHQRMTYAVTNELTPQWSANGERLLYVSRRWGQGDRLYVFDFATHEHRLVVSHTGDRAVILNPLWIDDTIVYMQGIRRTSTVIYPEMPVAVDNVAVSLSEPRPLADGDPLLATYLEQRAIKAQQSVTSRDGSRVITVDEIAGQWSLVVIEDGRINPIVFLSNMAVFNGPTIRLSPDGESAIYLDFVRDQWLDVFLIDVAGGEPRRLTTRGAVYPEWRP